MVRHAGCIERAYRLAFLRRYAELNAANRGFVAWMRWVLGLVKEGIGNCEAEDEEAEMKEEEDGSDLIWDATFLRYKKGAAGA